MAPSMASASRATISRQTSICAPPARLPVSACASEVSVPPVESSTIFSSWWRMKPLNGSCPRLPPMKSVSTVPFGQTETLPSSTSSAASR